MGAIHRLHLGAGAYNWPGYVNLDSETDLQDLPFADGSVAEIHAIHLFEHLPRLEVDRYLKEWIRVLQPGGKLFLELPCLDKIARLICDGEINQRLTVLGLFGDPRDPDILMRHQWAYTTAEIRLVLEAAGFRVQFAEPLYHYQVRDMRVIGEKA